MFKVNLIKKMIGLGILLVTQSNVLAENVQATVNTSAVLEKLCIVKVNDISFGDVDFTKPNIQYSYSKIIEDNTSAVFCSKGVYYSVNLKFNNNSVGTQRYMLHSNGVDKILYNIHKIPGLQGISIFGDGTNGTTGRSNIGDASYQPLIMNIRIHSLTFGQIVAKSGSYSDQLELSVEY